MKHFVSFMCQNMKAVITYELSKLKFKNNKMGASHQSPLRPSQKTAL